MHSTQEPGFQGPEVYELHFQRHTRNLDCGMPGPDVQGGRREGYHHRHRESIDQDM
jgi:hypothetical protein